MRVRVCKRARLHFEAIIPVAATHTLDDVAANGQCARLPLPDDMPVLMEHQPGVFEELGGTSSKIDPSAPGRRNGSTVQPHEQRVLEYLDVTNGFIEQNLERGADFRWQRDCPSDYGHGHSMIHTIGHSNHPIDRFVALLMAHGISALADVRSIPYSRFNPQFRREKLQASLAEAGIDYVFLGEELGARSTDPACYEETGRVRYSRLSGTPSFRRGIERLKTGMAKHRIAIMCAEREPLQCHRTILVARELVREGIPVAHILGDGSLESHEHAMERLAAAWRLPANDLFGDPAERLERAYELQAGKIAYVKNS